MSFRDFFITSTWWGKLIGAFFGFLSAGPLGAIFGLFVGNFFDRGLTEYYTNPHWLFYSEKHQIVHKVFFESTFSIMGHIAKADGRVTKQELDMAYFIMQQMKLNKEQQVRAKQLFNAGKHAPFNLNSLLTELRNVCKNRRDLLRLFVDIQYQSAQIDGLSHQKIQILDQIFSALDFAPLHKQYRFYEDFGAYTHQQQDKTGQQSQQSYSSSAYSSYKRQTKTNLDYAYALLQVSPNITKHELKKAYRRLLSQNHPDKLIAQGLPEEKIKMANEKTQKIVEAYDLICEAKGW